MQSELVNVFQQYIKVEFDERLYNNLKMLRWGWGQKSEEYMEFLGSNLVGVHTIRFSVQDEDMLFLDILNVDKSTLKKAIHNVNGINKAFKVASNETYMTLVYLMHGFSQSKLINKNMMLEAIRECYLIFAYKVISSLYVHYFKYQVEVGIAQSINERMSNKYLLKKFKNWAEVFDYRSNDVLPGGLHWDRIRNLDAMVIGKILNDLQSRIRDILKNAYTILIELKENNERIISTTLETSDADGEATVSDIVNRPDRYATFLKSICRSKTDFINPDICYIIEQITGLKIAQGIDKALEVIVEEYKPLEQFIDDVLISSMQCLSNKNIQGGYDKDLYNVILTLKTLYGNVSKIKLATKAKKDMSQFLQRCRDKRLKGKSFLRINMSVCVCVYVFLRAVTKNS